MANAQLDDNSQACIYGLSCEDGVTPIRIAFSGTNGGMKVDFTTPVLVTPSMVREMDQNSRPVARGTSISDDNAVLPWYVVPATGAVCVDDN